MEQTIKYIAISDLVLWTENPRDPIDVNATDQDVVNRAILDQNAKWNLKRLAKEMGDFYDFSELPTVVYIKNKPVVYDGNRRIILAKIKHKLVSIGNYQINVPDIPAQIPCNVCAERIALQNVYRKHAESGSWDPLERDIFLHKFIGENKSHYLIFDESTNGYISSHPELNKGFVRKEVLNDKNLSDLGFSFEEDRMLSAHNKDELIILLNDILNKVSEKKISTRSNRGDILGVLDTRTKDIINKNKSARHRIIDDLGNVSSLPQHSSIIHTNRLNKRTKRVKSNNIVPFGGPLYLKSGDINNLYRDICEIYDYYEKNKIKFSNSFLSIVRMSLRLLCESASKDLGNSKIDNYISAYSKEAKSRLSQDTKTFLSNLNVSDNTLPQLLHTGAHDYSASRLYEQTIGVSILLGAILSISHGKK